MGNARLRVLRVIYDLQVGGVQRQLLQVLPLLREHGIEPEICCLRAEGEMAGQFKAAGLPLHVVPFRTRLDPFGLMGLRRLVGRLGVEVVHGHMHASNVAANAALIFKGAVKIVNGYHSTAPFSGAAQARTARFFSRSVRANLAVSGSVAEALLAAGFAAEKVVVLHNGVSVGTGPVPLAARTSLEPIRLFWGGRFVKQKRLQMLVEIAKALRVGGVSFVLTLAGEGPFLEVIQNRVRAAGLQDVVLFPGWQKDLRPWFAEADLYLSASDREGFPNTLLECCAVGRGYLVADIAPNREVHGGPDANVLLSDSISDWVDRIAQLQKSPGEVEALGRAAFVRAEQFSLRETARKTAELYRGL